MIARCAVAVVFGACLAGVAPGADAAGGPSDAEVSRAIAKGVAYLKETREPDGSWSYSFNHDHTLGITALAGLALMENGVDPSDRVIGEAAEVVRTPPVRSAPPSDISPA